MIVCFAYTLFDRITDSVCAEDAIQWPPYTLENSMNYVFDANVSSHLELDTYREDAIDYLVQKYRGDTYPWIAHDQS
jgi:hypothetical protein